MSQRNSSSASSQTDSSNADTPPGHRRPDASTPPIIVAHARQAVLPQAPQGDYDQDVCVCITCHVRCPNDAALRKHGEELGHRPFACVCGSAFLRLDVLERHVASKNKVTRFPCPLCKLDETRRAFSRADHLAQHFRTFHKIASGRIPDDFGANFAHHDPAEDSWHPQSRPRFPCRIPGCTKTGDLAYLRQIDLDEHIGWTHYPLQNDMPIQQELDPTSAWTNNGFQQNVHLQTAQMFGQDAQQNYISQPDLIENFLAGGPFLEDGMFVENIGFPPHDESDIDPAMDSSLGLDSWREGYTQQRYMAN